ncbi:hypothetical protein GCM10007984_08440 [Shewanella putrefaciens]|nr:hypothetical protein GCM10007984_08440 [Shewanella putrefaciens]
MGTPRFLKTNFYIYWIMSACPEKGLSYYSKGDLFSVLESHVFVKQQLNLSLPRTPEAGQKTIKSRQFT